MLNRIEMIEKEITASELKGSLILFIKYFFKHITSRDFIISKPIGRESHHITLCRALTALKRLEIPNHRLNINVPPGYGKSTILCMWIAWCIAEYPDSNFLYISYSFDLAVKHTAFIKTIIDSKMYRYLFDVELKKESRAKDAFETSAGGKIKAFGSGGAITGQDAGLPGLDRFSGGVVIDDAHKVDEAHSDTQRKKVIDNYVETIRQRPRGINVPIINVGQRVHEADLSDFLIEDNDICTWESLVLKAMDDAGNALYPEIDPVEKLLALQDKSPYVFASQYQQIPSPAGGGLFSSEWFLELEEEPKMLHTFLTVDSAETDKNYNDPTAISFFGIYEIEAFGKKTGELGLHWIDCIEGWIDAKDLEDFVLDFWTECCRHTVPPFVAAIEKKSTGVTLIAALNKIQGIKIKEVERTAASGSKTARYIEMTPYIASKRVTFTRGGRHVANCKTHMEKITANNTHRHDDICHIAGSKIATIYGNKNVEDIRIGDKVITPFGIGYVSACGSTGFHKVISKFGLTSTPNHKVYTPDGFIPLDTLNDDAKIDHLSLKGLLRWKYLKLLCLTESNTHLSVRSDIILASQQQIHRGSLRKDFMLQFGNFIRARQFLKALLFITKTATILITTLTIWSAFRLSNTCRNIANKKLIMQSQKAVLLIFGKLKKLPRNGTEVKKAGNGIGKILSNACRKYLSSVKQVVLFAIKNFYLLSPGKLQKHAVCSATPTNIDRDLEILRENVLSVEMISLRKNNIHNLEIEKLAVSRVNQAPDHYDIKQVYSLTVENYGVYYCNGILLQNCDTLYDGIKIGLIDKSLYKFNSKTKSAGDDVMSAIGQQMRRQHAARANRNVR